MADAQKLDQLRLPLPGKTADQPFSVGALTAQIRFLLEDRIGEVWVAGEISNLRSPGSGHIYFTLKDADATLAAVMFRGEASRLRFKLADGMAATVRGPLTVYEPRGQYQIQALEIRPQGVGTLQQQFEVLKRKLAAEGLFETSRKRALPVFPETIGVISSLQAAGLQDFLKIIKRRAPGVRIQIRDVRVQGDGAAAEIATAIEAFNKDAVAQILIIARGGGSLEDLWAFNEEIVARALAASKIPTVSAIGHEIDFTIADFVADLRAPTPSAAAELIVRDWKEWLEELAQWQARLTRETASRLQQYRARWNQLRSSALFREPVRLVRQAQQRVDDLRDALRLGLKKAVRDKRHKLEKTLLRWKALDPRKQIKQHRFHLKQWEARIRTLGPQGTLDRGYAMVLDESGKIIKKAIRQLVGKKTKVILSRGKLLTRIEAIE
jgi:exodeoxyribonuclease VII large subunit